MYFYEIHEGDTDLYSDALLAHELEFDEDEFLRLVVEARRRVLDAFEEDSLVEAIAHDLERAHGFIHVDEARLTAAVNVSEREGETLLAEVGGAGLAEDDGDGDDEDDEDLDDLDPAGSGLRSLRVTLDRNPDLEADPELSSGDELPPD